MEEIVNGVVDLPKQTDYEYESLFGAVEILNKVENKRTDVQDQSIKRDPSTAYACTNFSMAHCINEMNAIEGSMLYVLGEYLWGMAIERGAGIDRGWTLQEALKLAKDKGYINGYASVKDINLAKQALSQGQMLYTGDNKCDWATTNKTHIWTVKEGGAYGHCRCIVGYDDENKWFICKNSYGVNKYDKGYFYLKYEDWNRTFTTYALVDTPNKDLVAKHKKMIDDKMKLITETLGLMNGKDLDQPFNREMAEIVFGRLMCMLSGKSVESPVEDILNSIKK